MRIYLTLLIVFLSCSAWAQRFHGFRISVNVAFAQPTGDFASEDGLDPLTTGFAQYGIDAGMGVELFLTPRISLMGRAGYALYELDHAEMEDKLRENISFDLSELALETTPYQNIYALAGPTYNLPLVKERLVLQPYVIGGLGIFRSSKKEYSLVGDMPDELLIYSNDTEVEPGFMWNPGLAFNYSLLSFVELRLFAEFMQAEYQVTERSLTQTAGTEVRADSDLTYRLQAMNFGVSFNVHF